MILKGIISSYVNEQTNKIKIRIPKYHRPVGVAGSTPNDELPYATIISSPGIKPQYIPGDIVYIDFEDDDLSKPCVIGKLNYIEDLIDSVSNIQLGDLSVTSATNLSSTTKIGDINYQDLLHTVQGFINAPPGGGSDYYYHDDGNGNISVIYYNT